MAETTGARGRRLIFIELNEINFDVVSSCCPEAENHPGECECTKTRGPYPFDQRGDRDNCN